jgi:signal peptidase I
MKVSVLGRSMEPTLYEGERALFRYWPDGIPETEIGKALGSIVLIRRSGERQGPELTIKRLKELLDTGLWVEGDNPDFSTDSRHYLTIPREDIVGRMLIRYHPTRRRQKRINEKRRTPN